MRRITLRSLWEHKRRLVSTVLAIVLGVAFMTGTFVIADTIDKIFDDLFSDVNEAVDVQVQGVELFSTGGFGGSDARELLDQSLVQRVAGAPGVEAAAPSVTTVGFGSANRVLDAEGEPVGASQGPPTLLESWISDEQLNPYRLLDGSSPPTADDHIAMNVAAVEDAGYSLGDDVTVLSQLGERTYTLVGIFTFGEAESAAGAVSADFTLAEAQRLSGTEGQVQTILVRGDGSTSQEELAAAVRTVLPPEAEAITGEQAAQQTADDVQQGFQFFRQVLLVFGAVALLVGTFIIANTFSILIAQRTRELALLRTIGASKAQVLRSVLLEAGVIGLVSALFGLAGGVLLATGVTALLDASGADLPTRTLVIGPNTIITALVTGLGVTMVAAVIPAVQATRVPPMAALRDVSLQRVGASRIRVAAGVLLLAGAAVGLSAAWRSGGDTDALPSVGVGALALIVGAIVIGPVLARPSVQVIGSWLPRLRGVTGRLATENAARSPKRTAATASALLIGVSLIGFITIFGASAQASIDAEVDRSFAGDLVVQSESGGFGPPGVYPASVADSVAAVEGVDAVARFGFSPARLTYLENGESITFMQSIDPATALRAMRPRMAEGAVTDLTPGGVIVDVGIAEDAGLEIGDDVEVTVPGGQQTQLTIQAIADDFTLLGFWTTTNEDLGAIVNEDHLAQTIVLVDDGADVGEVQARIEQAIARVPGMQVLDKEGFVGSLADQITSFLTLVNALLLLSVIIALIGIANTLSLSIHERTRELGLLRAVGMTRRQVRSTIRWEAVIIAILGTIVGLTVGLLASTSVLTALRSFGLNRISIPVSSMVFVTLATAALGVIAAIRPARRAARLDVLEAIATE